MSLLSLSLSGHSWSHGLRLYFNHLLSSLPSVPCLPRGRTQGGVGLWAGETPSAFGAGDLLSNCPDKGRTSQLEVLLLLQRKPQEGCQPVVWGLQLAPTCLLQSTAAWVCPALSSFPGEGTSLCLTRSSLSPEPGSQLPPARGHPGAGTSECPQPLVGLMCCPSSKSPYLCEWSPPTPSTP